MSAVKILSLPANNKSVAGDNIIVTGQRIVQSGLVGLLTGEGKVSVITR